MLLRKATPLVGVLSLAVLCGANAAAADREIHGRTGLPTVESGGQEIWMHRGSVDISAKNGNLTVDQRYQVRYPERPIEKGGLVATIAVREDYFRSIADNAPKVTPAEAKGFSRFDVWIDGQRVQTVAKPWAMNDKRDTATRWREWNVSFQPGEMHTMRIVSEAPLGWYDGNRWIDFVNKDLGHWRQPPDYLTIHVSVPHNMASRLVGYQPKPDATVMPSGIGWTYRKASPNRDIFILMPTGLAHRSPR